MEDSVNIGLICDEVVPRIPEGHTHLLIEVRSKKYAILYRLTDGMYQGEINDKMALFGENPNKRESRLFCSYEHGRAFVTGLAKGVDVPAEADYGQHGKLTGFKLTPACIYEYDYDSAHAIIIPGSVDLDLAVNGSGAKLPKTRNLN